jgi:ribose transport system substrate-binding protein
MRTFTHIVKGGVTLVVTALALFALACGSDDNESPSASGGSSSGGDKPSWCGDKEIKLALADGNAQNNWRRITVAEAKDEASKCPSVKEFIHTDGQQSTQKSISDIQSLAAQGVDAAVIYPDAGKALLPVLTQVTKAGMVTVPYWADIGGKPGENYTANMKIDWRAAGKVWAEWLVKRLDGKGNWIYIGGTPDNAQNVQRREGMLEVFKDYPGIKQIGPKPFAVTNWDPAEHQKQLAAAIAKYPKIDAVAADFGGGIASALPAFEKAGREVPVVLSEDNNSLGCQQKKLGFDLFTASTGNFLVRDAVRYAVAKATGGEVPSDKLPVPPPFEDSVSGKPNPVQCDEELSGDANLSSKLTREQLIEAIK